MSSTTSFRNDLERRADAIFAPEENETVVIGLSRTGLPLPQMATLASAHIPFLLEEGVQGVELHVPRNMEAVAQEELLAWEMANKHWPPPREEDPLPPPSVYASSTGWSLLPPLLLLLFFILIGPFDDNDPVHIAGCSNALAINNGGWWRCVTAMTLHGDMGHLLGNMVALWGFGLAVCRRVGIGLGWAGMLLAGALGNLLAVQGVLDAGRLSVGASTATFGALGILVALQTLRKWRHGATWNLLRWKNWIPLIAGLLLLGFLGMSERADQEGHLWGFISGVGVGALLFPLADKKLPWWLQAIIAEVILFVPIVAWEVALRDYS